MPPSYSTITSVAVEMKKWVGRFNLGLGLRLTTPWTSKLAPRPLAPNVLGGQTGRLHRLIVKGFSFFRCPELPVIPGPGDG